MTRCACHSSCPYEAALESLSRLYMRSDAVTEAGVRAAIGSTTDALQAHRASGKPARYVLRSHAGRRGKVAA